MSSEQHPHEEQPALTEQELGDLVQIRRDKLSELKAQGADPYLIKSYPRTHTSEDIKAQADELGETEVAIAGRMMSRRIMGKASFAHILDGRGMIQIYVKRDIVGEEAYDAFKKLDIGDILGVQGPVFRTRTGEITVQAQSCTLLSKALLPLPEKYHGLKDADLRYRQRYLDLIVNPEVRDTFIARSKILREVRNYMDDHGYLEVDTPVLHNYSTNSGARPFKTHHNTLDIDMYMRVETELHLKRLIVGGLEKVYEIGRIFRNEGMDTRHNPEFTTIEMYAAYEDYTDMMTLAENLFQHVARKVVGTCHIQYQGMDIDLTAPWTRMTMVEAVRRYASVDFDSFSDDATARALAKEHSLEVRDSATWGDVLALFFDEYVEENLIQPTIIYEYPVEISPLAKRKPSDPRLTERFEFFMARWEGGNSFTELNDPIDQRERFIKQAMEKHGENEDFQIDEDFVTALEYGMPPTGGMGIGIERMIMLLTDSPSIRDVLLFPTMKPKA